MEGSKEADEAPRGVVDYYHFLRRNHQYRRLWLGELVNTSGMWLNYIAVLNLVERYGDGSGLLLSGVVVLRMVPSALMCPIAGAVADKCNRVKVLVWSCLLDAVVVAMFPLVRSAAQLWLLYALLFLQFSTEAFYDPARRALVPLVAGPRDLPLATTLDSFCWSLTGALGAMAGGWASSKLGTTACFMIDAATYALAALCAAQVDLRAVPAVKVALEDGHGGDADKLSLLAQGAKAPAQGSKAPAQDAGVGGVAGGARPLAPAGQHRDEQAHGGDQEWAALHVEGGGRESAAGGASASPAEVWRRGMAAIGEGWAYMAAPDNRDVGALVCIKTCGALCWGTTDILNVKFAELPQMQSLGDSSFTLGLIFGAVGAGCFVGPIAANYVTPSAPLALLRSIAAAFGLLMAGYGLMLAAQRVAVVVASTFVRAMGSATLWVYATLVLQLRVPNGVLGRVMAVEAAMYTSVQSCAALVGGLMFDSWRMGLRAVVAVNVAVSAAMTAVWVGYWLVQRRRAGPRSKGYRAVSCSEELAA